MLLDLCSYANFRAFFFPLFYWCNSMYMPNALVSVCTVRQLKRYPEPMADGPEACEPSHQLWPMARRPVSRNTRAEAVDTGCQRDIPVL